MKVLVVGLGKSGLAACELLIELGREVIATDVDATPQALAHLEQLKVKFVTDFVPSDLTVISPGVPADLPQLAGRNVIGDLELAYPHFRGPIIGITGSNGKTTTTALTGHILTTAGIPNQVGGNIGVAPAAMARVSKTGEWNVLEISSFQLETTRVFRPDIGVCLNVTPNHLDRHHTFEAYRQAKSRMFLNQTAGDSKVLNAADPACRSYSGNGSARTIWFNQGDPPDELSSLKLPGRHNFENAWAAVEIARVCGAKTEPVRNALATFPGVEHRLEYVHTIQGVRYYNDSKATSVDATLKAIAALEGPLWVILGGKDKGSDYRPLIAPLRGRVRRVLLVGAAAEKIASHIGEELPAKHAGTIAQAVEIAHREAVSGDTVLLAPACASFDQFQSFEHRGEVFKQLVRNLENR